MLFKILLMLGTTILQSAMFTLVSRARNSTSVSYHAIASVLSNTVWILVLRNVVQNLDSTPLIITYIVGSVTGSVLMHIASMKWFEKQEGK